MEHIHGTRASYAREIGALEEDVLEMASMAESMVTRAVDSLQRLDVSLAYQVLNADDAIDVREISLEQRCLKLLALQQPMARDLREIGTVIKIVTDIERIADLAVDIAKITLKVDKELGATDFVDIPLMANVARQMARKSTQMFVRKDAGWIEEVAALEEQVDALYRSLRSQIFDHMISNPDEVVSSGWLLLAIHHIERVADHAMNIAERCYFMVTGQVASKETPAAS